MERKAANDTVELIIVGELEDVATTLEISVSALAERLHRGQSSLIEHYYFDDLY